MITRRFGIANVIGELSFVAFGNRIWESISTVERFLPAIHILLCPRVDTDALVYYVSIDNCLNYSMAKFLNYS